jgi:antitoxin component of RelBE/YafQ-DinJ toxin-antitoxin module
MDAVLNFKTEKKLKIEAQKVAKDLGLPLGTIMNHYLKELVREKRVLFSSHPTPSKKVVEELKLLSRDAREGKNISPVFTNIEDALAWLDK